MIDSKSLFESFNRAESWENDRVGSLNEKGINIKAVEASIKKIATLTDENRHTEAGILGATVLDHQDLLKKFKEIQAESDRVGSNPRARERDRLLSELTAYAKKRLSPELGDAFYSAF